MIRKGFFAFVMVLMLGGTGCANNIHVEEIRLGEIDITARFWGWWNVAVSSDVQHMAYVRHEDGKAVVVSDGIAGKRYGGASGIRFSSQGTVGYIAIQGGERFAVIDGNEGLHYQKVQFGLELFSRDGKRFAYKAQKDENTWVVVVDGVESESYEKVTCPVFFPESGKVIYGAFSGGKWFLVNEDNLPEELDCELDPNTRIVVSAKGDNIAFSGREDEKDVVIVNGNIEMKYNHANYPIFSPDGRRFAYIVVEGDKRLIVCDNKEEIPFEGMLFDYRFSANGRYFGYGLYKDDQYYFVVNGIALQKHNGLGAIGLDALGKVIFSPDENHVTYSGPDEPNDATLLVRDGIVTPLSYDRIVCATFSPDSKHLVYVATRRRGNGDEKDIIEDIAIGVDDKIVWRGRGKIMTPDRIVFLDKSTFRVGIFKGREVDDRFKGPIVAVEIMIDD